MWAPSQAFIYFVQGTLPDAMDIWRIKPTGGTPERITHHNSRVSHPVLWNERTLLYLASDPDGSGPRLYSVDVERRMPHRLSVRPRQLHVAGGQRRRSPARRDRDQSERDAVGLPIGDARGRERRQPLASR